MLFDGREDCLQILLRRSLIRRVGEGMYQLHDLQSLFLRRRAQELGKEAAYHQYLLEQWEKVSNGDATLVADDGGYLLTNRPARHYCLAGRAHDITSLLFTASYLSNVMSANGAEAGVDMLIHDAQTIRENLQSIGDASTACDDLASLASALRLGKRGLALGPSEITLQLSRLSFSPEMTPKKLEASLPRRNCFAPVQKPGVTLNLLGSRIPGPSPKFSQKSHSKAMPQGSQK